MAVPANRALEAAMSRIGELVKASMALCLMAAFAACSAEPNTPPMASVTQIETVTRPAKDPNCYMPVIYAEPTVDYRKVAIVYAWASLKYSESQVLEEVKRKACETRADAVLYLSGSQQKSRRLLYEGAPNPTRQAGGASETEADFINDREKEADVGSVGHRGTYVDAVAIVYTNPGAAH